jgi:hypothetical protein
MLDPAAIFAGIAQALPIQIYFAARVIDQADTELDEGGSIPDDQGEPTFRTCMVQVDAATEAMRQADGYAEGDVRFLILAATLEGTVNTDATVEVLEGPHVGTWLVSAIERDPLAIYHQGRGRRAPTE